MPNRRSLVLRAFAAVLFAVYVVGYFRLVERSTFVMPPDVIPARRHVVTFPTTSLAVLYHPMAFAEMGWREVVLQEVEVDVVTQAAP